MPRRSSTALQFPPVDGRPSRLRIPDDLPASLVKIIEQLIASHEPEHFRDGDEFLLTQFAQSVVLANEAYAQLQEQGPVAGAKWLITWEKSTRATIALSGRLRLAPQMRAESRSAGRQPPKPPHPRPWLSDGETK
jgi:hypothetical protein